MCEDNITNRTNIKLLFRGDVYTIEHNFAPDNNAGRWMDRKWTLGVERFARIDHQMDTCLAIATNCTTDNIEPEFRRREGL